jgi:hypothetical protein
MTAEARAAKSEKRAARWAVAKQRAKDKKLAEEKVKQAEILQSVHARATAEALAKQVAVHAVTMLKGEVVTQFTIDNLGSTASSCHPSVAAGALRRRPYLRRASGLPNRQPIASGRAEI